MLNLLKQTGTQMPDDICVRFILIGSTSYSYFFAPKGKCFSADQNQPPPAGSKACHRKRYHKPRDTKWVSLLCFPLRRWEGFQREGISEISSPVSILLFTSVSSCLQPELWDQLLKLQRISSYQDCLASDITINCEITLQMCMSYLLKEVRGRKGWIIFFPLKFSFQNVSGKRALSNLTSCKAHTASSVSCNNLYRA